MAVVDEHVFPGFLIQVLTYLSLQSHRLLFSHASADVRGKNIMERRFASTGNQTHNHQIMSLTCSPLSHPEGAFVGKRGNSGDWCKIFHVLKNLLDNLSCVAGIHSWILWTPQFYATVVRTQNQDHSGLCAMLLGPQTVQTCHVWHCQNTKSLQKKKG